MNRENERRGEWNTRVGSDQDRYAYCRAPPKKYNSRINGFALYKCSNGQKISTTRKDSICPADCTLSCILTATIACIVNNSHTTFQEFTASNFSFKPHQKDGSPGPTGRKPSTKGPRSPLMSPPPPSPSSPESSPFPRQLSLCISSKSNSRP